MINLAIENISNLLDLGGFVVGILLIMSILVFGIVLWKLIIFELEGIGREVNRGFLFHALKNIRINDINKNDIRKHIYAKLDLEFGRATSGLRFIDLTVQIAPLLGLFGTVLGMIKAFRTLQEIGNSADPSVLAGGIWVALLTTAAGLIVAIPSSLFLSWFDSRIERHRRKANLAVEELLSPIEDKFDNE